MRVSSLILLASASTTYAWSHLFERAPVGCIADNCLRAITGTQPGQTQSATNRPGDCSSFLGALGGAAVSTVTPSTVTVTQTASFGASATSSQTTTTTTTSTTPTTITTTTSMTTTSISSTTTTTKTTDYAANVAKRVAPTFPAYASPCSSAARYSSACSCAGISASTTTLPTPTFTLTISVTSTTTFDVMTTSTSIMAAASTVTDVITGTLTTSLTIVSTSVRDAVIATSTPGSTLNINGQILSEIFSDSGYSISPSSSANSNSAFPALTETLPGFLDKADAVQQCADYVYGINGYGTIAVDFLLGANAWLCTGYYNPTATADDFSVADSNVGASYGYIVDAD